MIAAPAFAKLKHLLRKAAARTHDQFWKAGGHACDIFKLIESNAH